jgi:hypothetical protein
VNVPVTGQGQLVIPDGKINFANDITTGGGLTVNVADVSVAGQVNTGPLALTNSLGATVPLGNQNVPLVAALKCGRADHRDDDEREWRCVDRAADHHHLRAGDGQWRHCQCHWSICSQWWTRSHRRHIERHCEYHLAAQ